MIIRRLTAEGFLRYESLSLQDLPAGGLVAILGDNESGKTTIGECIAFTLFGESVRSHETDVSQLVGWDQTEARCALEFTVSGRTLRITREIDREGAHRATLSEGPAAAYPYNDEDATGEYELIAQGPDEVAQTLKETTGLDFSTFRKTLYLAQQETDLLRRAGVGEVRATIEEVFGIGVLERAAEATRLEMQELLRGHDDVRKDLAVAEAILEAQSIRLEAAEETETEGARWQAQRVAAEEALPAARAATEACRNALAARASVASTFNELKRSLIATAAANALARTGDKLSTVRRGLEDGHARDTKNLESQRQRADRLKTRIDRLIDYRTEMGKLEARIELYRNELKRSLEAPAVSDKDLAELEGIALPSTPAAGQRLAALRVEKVRRARNRAGWRAVIFLVVGLIFGAVGFPALYQLSQHWRSPVAEAIADADALSGLQRLSTVYGKALDGLGLDADSGRPWLFMFAVGVLGLGLGVALSLINLSQFSSRGDELALAEEGHRRLRDEVTALEQELGTVSDMSLRKPLVFKKRLEALHNPAIREMFEAIEAEHADFLEEDAQGSELVNQEREKEADCRAAVVRGEGRLARLQRLLHSLPSTIKPAGGDAPPPFTAGDLSPVEERIQTLLEAFERARRDQADQARGGEPGEPEELVGLLGADLERVNAAPLGESSGDEATEEPPADRTALSALTELVGVAEGLTSDDMERRLGRIGEALEGELPSVLTLTRRQSTLEASERREAERHAEAAQKLDGLRDKLAEIRAWRRGQQEREQRVTELRAKIAPLAHQLEVETLLAELLREAADDLRERVGPMLERFAARVLPRLTAGRYHRVRVTEGLTLRVYSPEKNDYVPLSDLSVGAADQLMLLIRLGISFAMVKARGQGNQPHFLFLDEPLASFDAARARAFVEILQGFSLTFPQVFLVAHQKFEGMDALFDRIIRTNNETRVLESGSPVPEETTA
ncbi:MAG: AAA family ATPase [Planctomycetota bacterium]